MGKNKIRTYTDGTECVVTIKEGANIFTGRAKCHPEDKEFFSTYTGYIIAEMRAKIAQIQHYKNTVVRPKLKTLEDLKKSFNCAKLHDKTSYESKLVDRLIENEKINLQTCYSAISSLKEDIKVFIAAKESFYNQIRSKQDKDKE